MIFNTPEEAIAACNAQCQEAFEEFILSVNTKGGNIDRASNAFQMTKNVFTFGFMRGAEFITSVVIKASIEKPKL